MTREAMLLEINQLPDNVLADVLNLIKVSGLAKMNVPEVISENREEHKYRTAGALKGKIILHDDFDEPLEEMKEYMG